MKRQFNGRPERDDRREMRDGDGIDSYANIHRDVVRELSAKEAVMRLQVIVFSGWSATLPVNLESKAS
jgi:hypothetical protein